MSLNSRDANGSKASLTSLEVRFAKSPLSGSRRRLIREILDNHEQTFFLSSREMAKRYNVDAATIVRTVQALGYERFADFAADLRQHFVKHITPYTVLKAATQEKRSVIGSGAALSRKRRREFECAEIEFGGESCGRAGEANSWRAADTRGGS